MSQCIGVTGGHRCPQDALRDTWYCRTHRPTTISESLKLAGNFVWYCLTRPLSLSIFSWFLLLVGGVWGGTAAIYTLLVWANENGLLPPILQDMWAVTAITLIPVSLFYISFRKTPAGRLDASITILLAYAWAFGRAAWDVEILRGDRLLELVVTWWYPALLAFQSFRAVRRWWTSPEVQEPEEPRDPNLPRPRILPFTKTWWERHPRARRWLLQDVENAPAKIWEAFRTLVMIGAFLLAGGVLLYFTPRSPLEIWKVIPGCVIPFFIVWIPYFVLTSIAGWYLPHAGANLPKEETIEWEARPHPSAFLYLMFRWGFIEGEGHHYTALRFILGLGPILPLIAGGIVYYAFKFPLFVYPVFWLVVMAFAIHWILWAAMGFGWIHYAVTGTAASGHMITTRPRLRLWGMRSFSKIADRKTLNTATRDEWFGGIGVVDPASILEKKGDSTREQVIFIGVHIHDVPGR